MPARLISGQDIARTIRDELNEQVAQLAGEDWCPDWPPFWSAKTRPAGSTWG